MRYVLTDELGAVMGPLVERAKRHEAGQRPGAPDRAFFEAVLCWARTGVPWRDLPAEFGPWDAVYNRPRRWVDSGSRRALFGLLAADPDPGEVRRVPLDATIARAHPHAAGAPRKKKRSGPSGRCGRRRSARAGAGGRPRSSWRRPTRTPPWPST